MVKLFQAKTSGKEKRFFASFYFYAQNNFTHNVCH